MKDSATSVGSGQQALKSWNNYPWYDAGSDSLRRVTIKPEEPTAYNGSGVAMDGLGYLLQSLVWFTLAVGIAIIVYFLVKAFLNRDRTPRTTDALPDAGHARRIEALPMNLDEKESDLLAAARRYYAAGNLAKAIVCYFGYQLVELDRRQFILLTQGKTNRQYLRELGQRAQLRQIVSQTMVVSEDAFFGHHDPQPATFEACWSRLAEFQKLLGQEG